MNSHTRYLFLTTCACIALSGCGATAASTSGGVPTAAGGASSSATAGAASGGGPAASSASIPYPTAVGDTWVYKDTFPESGQTSTTTDKVVASTSVADGHRVTIIHTTDVASVRLTFVFHSDGSINYPFAETGGQTASAGSSVLWPSAAVIASGRPVHERVTIHAGGAGAQTDVVPVTVQGGGTATVTVPAGTYQATLVIVTMVVTAGGTAETVTVKSWFAPGVGPVKGEQIITRAGSTTTFHISELTSFTGH